MEPIYQLEGVVLRGKRIGRTLGVPTANLPLPQGRDVPENGIYIAQVFFPGEPGRREPAVLSQGVHPTLPEGEPTVEVFLLSCSEDLYDQPIRVQYLAYIRPEIKFDSRDALRERMQQDIREARAYFGIGG